MEPPKVTGLSPKEGEPGTKVIIRGENLGTSQRDLLSMHMGAFCLSCFIIYMVISYLNCQQQFYHNGSYSIFQ